MPKAQVLGERALPGNPWTSGGSSDQHHIVMTFDVSTSAVELFVDGVSQGTSAQPGLDFNSAAHFRIGNTGWTNYEQWGGVITGVAISDVKLAPGSFVLEAGTNPSLGDFDEDGDVDGSDFLQWQRGFNVSTNTDDLTDWQDNYGIGIPVAAALSSEPEPVELAASVSIDESFETESPVFLLSLEQYSPRANEKSSDTVFAESFASYGEELGNALPSLLPAGSADLVSLSDQPLSNAEESTGESLDALATTVNSGIDSALDLAFELLG